MKFESLIERELATAVAAEQYLDLNNGDLTAALAELSERTVGSLASYVMDATLKLHGRDAARQGKQYTILEMTRLQCETITCLLAQFHNLYQFMPEVAYRFWAELDECGHTPSEDYVEQRRQAAEVFAQRIAEALLSRRELAAAIRSLADAAKED